MTLRDRILGVLADMTALPGDERTRVADRMLEAIAVDAGQTTDPRTLGGSIAGPGGPSDQGAVVLDTRRALIPDNTTVAMVDDSNGPHAGVLIEGRVNRTRDRARVLLIGSPDALAAWVSELIHLAARASTSPLKAHRDYAQQFQADLDRRMGGHDG